MAVVVASRPVAPGQHQTRLFFAIALCVAALWGVMAVTWLQTAHTRDGQNRRVRLYRRDEPYIVPVTLINRWDCNAQFAADGIDPC